MGHIAITTFEKISGSTVKRRDVGMQGLRVRQIQTKPKTCHVPKNLKDVFSLLRDAGGRPALVHVVTGEKLQAYLVPQRDASMLKMLPQ